MKKSDLYEIQMFFALKNGCHTYLNNAKRPLTEANWVAPISSKNLEKLTKVKLIQ